MELDWQAIKAKIAHDPHMKQVIMRIMEDPLSYSTYSRQEGLQLNKNRPVLSATSKFIPEALNCCHDQLTKEHSGFLRKYKRIALDFCWPKMKKRIKMLVGQCAVCQQQKISSLSPTGLLQ